MKLKKIIISLLAVGVVTGGLIVFNQPQPLTYEEYQTLLEIYNYEIEKAGGEITLGSKENPVTKENIVKLLNEKLLETPQPESIKIDGEDLLKEDYQLLKSGLFQKAEN